MIGEPSEVVRTIPPEASIRLAANGQPRGLLQYRGNPILD